jgi:excisionase family DNA binding protein
MTAPDLMTTAQTAERLGCSISTVLRMVEDRRLAAAQKLGGKGPAGAYLFTAAEVERAAAERAAELRAELERLDAGQAKAAEATA